MVTVSEMHIIAIPDVLSLFSFLCFHIFFALFTTAAPEKLD